MAELDFAAWTATIGNTLGAQRSITTTDAVTNWETELFRDSIYTSQSSDTQKKVSQTGRYLVRYDLPITDNPFATSQTRANVRATLRKNGSQLVQGRSSAYWRNAQASNRGSANAGAILELAADDYVQLYAQRTDTNGAAGSTIRDNSKEGSFGLWRLKDDWRLFSAQLTADAAASTTSYQDLEWDDILVVDTLWSGTVGGSITELEFDPSGETKFNEALFLICVSVEALSDSAASEGEFEIHVEISDGEAASPSYVTVAKSTRYAEGVNGCRTVVATWMGLLKVLENPLPTISPTIKISYKHLNSNGVTFTPKANACSVQVVAIPPDEIDFCEFVKVSGGQAADVDGAIEYDTLVHEDPPFQAGPGGDNTKIRAIGDGGMWAFAMGWAYAAPLGGARGANRLNHALDLQVNGVRPAYGRGIALNRGTNGCEYGGVGTHGFVKMLENEDLQIYHDQLSNQTDANVDWDGGYITSVVVVRLRPLAIPCPLGTLAVEGLVPTPKVRPTTPLGTLAIEGLSPTPRVRQAQELGTLALIGIAPAPRLRVSMPLAELVLEPYAPSPIIRCTAPLGELVLEPYAPTPRVRCNPELGELVLEPYAPAGRVRCNPELGELVLEPYAPSPRVRCASPLGELVIEPYDPAARIRCHPELGTLALEPFSPTIQADVRLDMPLGTIVLIGLPPEAIPEMLTNRKRLYDAMRQRILAAQFPWMQFDNLNAIIIEGTNQMPSSAVLNEKTATYTPVPKRNRRHQFQETNIWAWELILQFNRQVSCELFERDLLQTPVTLPEDEANGLEAVTFRFVSANYEHPTEQQPSTGTKATYQLVAEVSPR